MKNIQSIIIFGGALIALLASCGNESIDKTTEELSSEIGENLNPKETSPKEGQVTTGNYDYFLFSKDKKDSSELIIDYAYYSVNESGKTGVIFKDTVNQIIADFVDAVSDMSEERKRPSFSVSMFQESLPLFASFYEEMTQDDVTANMLPWQIQSQIVLNDSFPDYVQLTTASWSYTGGAHGNGFVVHTLIAKEDGREMKMDEFFKDIKGVNLLAATVLKKERNLDASKPLSEAGFWVEDESNFLSDNFFFENGDLIVHFNQYEIALYADGPIEIRVSKTDLNKFLK